MPGLRITGGRGLVLLILASAAVAGGGVYYAQVYAYYDRVPVTGARDVVLQPAAGGPLTPILHTDFQAIDAESSPIRYRACFSTTVTPEELTEVYIPHADPRPLNAPRWFSCFDAGALEKALSRGEARAFLSIPDVHPGIDRVVAVTRDGHGFAWNQFSACGTRTLNGGTTPEDCGAPPT